jgi:alanine or glycine:cation symporter, AGCS family
MFNLFFSFLGTLEDLLWGYIGVPIVLFVGIFLTLNSNFLQIRKFPSIVKIFFSFFTGGLQKGRSGVHPLKAFFACVGGCVGVGNVVGICTAVQMGGPGALIWIWITAVVGMMLKYAEVYLGLRYRIPNRHGSFDGGPMYFLQKAFKNRWIPNFVAVLLCIYGVEIYQFNIVTNSIINNLNLNPYIVITILLALVMFAGSGGVRRVGSISSAIIPFFVLVYVGMGSWLLLNNIPLIPIVIGEAFKGAFTGHAAIGGFVGSTILMTISQGVRRGCYTTDVGIGYASVIHSESSVEIPEKQASLVIFDIFVDTFMICTTSVAILLVTEVWLVPMEAGMLVQTALSMYFPYMNFFMPLFLLLLGYNTINAYFCVGIKCAEYLSPRRGRQIYFLYAAAILFGFSFVQASQAQTIMAVVGALLLIINSWGIFKLRKEISYNFDFAEAKVEERDPILISETPF